MNRCPVTLTRSSSVLIAKIAQENAVWGGEALTLSEGGDVIFGGLGVYEGERSLISDLEGLPSTPGGSRMVNKVGKIGLDTGETLSSLGLTFAGASLLLGGPVDPVADAVALVGTAVMATAGAVWIGSEIYIHRQAIGRAFDEGEADVDHAVDCTADELDEGIKSDARATDHVVRDIGHDIWDDIH